MTTEAVYLDRCVDMTTLAELAFRINRNKLPLVGFARVTVNAPLQAVAGRTDPLMDRQIPLMFDELKVVATHDLYRLYTLRAARLRHSRGKDLCNDRASA